jgi:GxxExxY protein
MTAFDPIPEKLERYAHDVIDAAVEIHLALGPGLLESVYEMAMRVELEERSIPFETQVRLPIRYKSQSVTAGMRLDIWVDRALVIELKAVERLEAIHTAQLLTYLKLTQNRIGLLINFNTPRIRQGIRRLVY